MKLSLLNTIQGLKPMYDADYDEKKKLKIGEVYFVDIKIPRNYRFHKKYFALINCAWEYQDERTQAFFNESVEAFRKAVEIAAGHFDLVYSIEKKEWLQAPKSISFSKMDEAQFSDLYESVKRVLFSIFLKNIDEDTFTQNLIDF